ncbi:3'-5' exonuclease [Mesosutterella sp. AGMB02718]|uniref:DNA 3'-5' helicase n=1 Tax=Mesosutterella faecium TaxID=2925194 RepID=A0ABT7IN69_9BURK|nr:3'-5' exonuclease [Mesosutterella sp. AGMB02718]MDL2059824.1 3'-5' exonuclease [Mesosutterella sp. AGMB02718]
MPDTDAKTKPQVVLLPELLEAFWKAPSVIRDDLYKFITRFRLDPLDKALKPRREPGAPENFRIYEVNSAWSAVAAFPEPELAVLLTANWSKSALEWARSHNLKREPTASGSLLFRLVAGETEKSVEAPPPPRPLFEDIPDEELLAIGLGKENLPLVRSFTSRSSFENARSAIPPEAFESLAWFMNGAAWTAVKREHAKLHHTAQSQMDKMRLYLNPEQEKIVRGPWKHAVLVQGGAGTGKSVVAMHRAKYLVELPDWQPGDRLLFVTATKNLAVDIKEQLQRLVRADRIGQIEVTNLDGWVTSFLRRNGYKPAILYPRNPLYDAIWKNTTATMPEGCTAAEAREEFEKHVLPNNIRLLKSYLASRDSRLPEDKRRTLWPVFEAFRRELFARGRVAAPDAYYAAIGLLATGAEEGMKPLYRAVVADEIQDFGPEALKLLRALAPDHDRHPELRDQEGDLFLVGDIRERIYGGDVSFKNCGINIKGARSLRLTVCYRTTAEISAAANFTLTGKNEEEPAGTAGTLRHGPEPALYVGREFDDEVSWIVRQIHALLEEEKDMPLSSIVIAARTDSLLDDYQRALSQRGIRTLQISRNVPDDPNAAGVRSATLHRLKGLEFRAVFIAGADDGNIPDAQTLNEAATPEERSEAELAERTLFHVALTRAVDRLYVSCSDTPGEYLKRLLDYEKEKSRRASGGQ